MEEAIMFIPVFHLCLSVVNHSMDFNENIRKSQRMDNANTLTLFQYGQHSWQYKKSYNSVNLTDIGLKFGFFFPLFQYKKIWFFHRFYFNS